ncbi:AI-2E family transporter [Methylocystis sp. MJC1]|uniref:AI-2E family transporter n=1 Tax=Methylocystis sp. MJC1 TaxID=2654282 RepID=UPI0013EBA9F2|nr:AI-2E family transporter [Methylocystis sp. MJC1]MBU6526432.1 AI-2E family transporter [Methylocystis sp. MJC1]UZX12874.1 AI-2E family transporter [Methylocystis sp. MJC1]
MSAAVLGVVFHELRWALLPFVLASLLAYLCNPLVERLSVKFQGSRLGGAVVVFLAILASALVIASLGLPPLLREMERLVTDLQSVFSKLAHSFVDDRTVMVLGKSMNAEQLAEAAATAVRDWTGQAGRVTELGTISFAVFFGCVLVLVLLFYLLLQGPEIWESLLWLAPAEKRPVIRKIWSRLGPLLWRYILGVLIVVAYAILAAYIGLGLVLGLRHALFLALITGVLEMIPVIGPGASALIAGLVAIRNATGIGPVIGYAIYAIVLRLSIDQLLGPLVLGAAATVSPVVIIFCFLVGGALFGIPGIVLAVPAAIAVKTSLAVLRDEPPPIRNG